MDPFTEEKQTAPSEETQADAAEKDGGTFFGDLMDLAEAGMLTGFVFILIFIFLLRRVTVDGGSMNPTLLDHDQIMILTPVYEPKNGQIVVIDDQESGLFADESQQQVMKTAGAGMVLVKRLIAKAGQEIDIDFETGDVKVDGTLLQEPYIAEPTRRDEYAFHYPVTIPEGYVFVMGDNRMNSMDSRSPNVALIPEEEILGTALFRYDRDGAYREKWTDRFDSLF